jgi:hypothetical protein
MSGKHLDQLPVCLGALGDYQEAGGVLIEAVDDTGTLRTGTPGYLVTDEPVHKSARGMSPGRMGDDTGRLVHYQQVLVLKGNREVHLFRFKGGRLGRGYVGLHIIPGADLVILVARFTVYPDKALADKTLCRRARTNLGNAGQQLIQTLAFILSRDRKGDTA